MKFQTLSVVIGDERCNATCSFCVAKMTGKMGSSYKLLDVDRLYVACRLAEKCDVTTVLLTGKGEPTLFPQNICQCIKVVSKFFPLIELQTNGLDISWRKNFWEDKLRKWVALGLTTIAISIVHYSNIKNNEIYCNYGEGKCSYPDLRQTIDFLHDCGLSIRLNCIGLKNYIDTPYALDNLLTFAKSTGYELQVTWRPVAMPSKSANEKVIYKTKELLIDDYKVNHIRNWANKVGTLLLKLPHGAEVFDIGGQNLCLTNCLTRQPDEEVIRQLIFAGGRLRYDWECKGAIIL